MITVTKKKTKEHHYVINAFIVPNKTKTFKTV